MANWVKTIPQQKEALAIVINLDMATTLQVQKDKNSDDYHVLCWILADPSPYILYTGNSRGCKQWINDRLGMELCSMFSHERVAGRFTK